MSSHVKAPSAGPIKGPGARRANGNGAPSLQLLALIVLAIAALFALAAAPALATPPSATIDLTPTAGYTSAEVSGTVTPSDEGETYYAFEYSTDNVFWSGFSYLGPLTGPAAPVSTTLGGLAPATHYYVRLVANNLIDPEVISAGPNPEFTTLAMSAPMVTIDAPNPITGTSAHLSGAINPGNADPAFNSEWHFECNPECPGLEGGTVTAATSPQPVSVEATGLEPNTAYQVTLVGSNPGGSASAEESFTTKAIAPTIVEASASDALRTELTLNGSVNPNNQAATYHFDYGTTSAYGSQTPSGSLASAFAGKAVQSTVSGLAPDTIYHFRLVAENAAGKTESPDQTIRTAPAAAPASPFGYQLVSPADKNGVDVQNILKMSPDGNIVEWASLGAYADPQGSNTESAYFARRDPSGTWTTTDITPKQSDSARQEAVFDGAFAPSEDFRHIAIVSKLALDPADHDGEENIFTGGINGKADVYLLTPGQEPQWVSGQVDGPPPNEPVDARIVGISDDGSTVFFRTPEALSSLVAPGAGSCDGSILTCHLYRWHDGKTELVGVDQNGALLPGSCLGACNTIALGATGNAGDLPDSEAISPDGEEFVYTSVSYPEQLYLHHRNGSVTQISVSQATATLGQPSSTQLTFEGALPDFSAVYLTSGDQLTNDAPVGGGVYRYDIASGQLSFMNPGGPSSVKAISADGKYIYFTDTSALAPGATAGQSNFYVNGPDGIRFIAPAVELSAGNGGLTPDGKNLVFTTNAQATAYDTAGTKQVYVYHAETDTLRCVSCNPRQTHSTGEGAINNGSELLTAFPHAISADGTRIAFVSTEALLPADTNGKQDVYEDINGQLHLVSTGTSGFGSNLAGLSADGHQVLFLTRSTLDPADIDGGLLDIYAARDDVASNQATPPAPPCTGDGCQAPATAPQTAIVPGSSAVGASGNQKPKKAKKRHHKKKHAHKKSQKRAGHNRGGSK